VQLPQKRTNVTAAPGQHDPDFLIDPALALRDETLKRALEFWNAKRGARFAPARVDIDPRGAKAFLPRLQLFDVVDGGRAIRVRLVGTAMVQALKEDTTGQAFDDTSPREVVHRVLRAVRWVVENRKPLRTYASRTALEGKDFLSHETLFLPLSNDGATIDMVAVVGVFAPAAE
jgi:hypothetical protein